jgi:hypothetical protein
MRITACCTSSDFGIAGAIILDVRSVPAVVFPKIIAGHSNDADALVRFMQTPRIGFMSRDQR